MIYHVAITNAAEIDLDKIAMYISNELYAPEAALALLDEMDQHIVGLEQMPKKFPLVSDERLAQFNIRYVPVKNYIIFYTVDDYMREVTIIRILYSKRDWISILSSSSSVQL